MNFIKLFLIISTGLYSFLNYGQSLDPNFATNGYTQDVLSYGKGKEIVIQPDGKILVATQRYAHYANTNDPDKYYLYCNRYNQDGSLDSSFGLNGIARAPHYNESEVQTIDIQPNGKILLGGQSKYCGNIVCGYTNLALGRLNSNGSVDLSFGDNGSFIAEDILGPMYLSSRIKTVKTLSSGKILISGFGSVSTDGTTSNYEYHTFIAKLNDDGSLDTSFGPTNSGIYYADQTLAIDSDMFITDDGSILWLTKNDNYQTVVLKLSSNGILDTNFGTGGAQTVDIGTNENIFVSIDFRDDDKMVLGGYIYNSTQDSSIIVTLNSDGSMYSQINQCLVDIPMNNSRINSVKCVSGNRVLIAGTLICDTSSYLNSARLGFVGLLNEDGTYDPSFSDDGIMTFNLAAQGNWNRTFIEDMEVLSNGDIICTGGRFATFGSTESQLLLFSLNSEGMVASSNSLSKLSNIKIYPNPATNKLFIEGYQNLKNISIFNINGQKVMNAEGFDEFLDISKLTTGLYIIQFTTLDGKISQDKLVVE